MSGKYETNKAGKKKSRKWFWAALLAALLVGVLVIALSGREMGLSETNATDTSETEDQAAAADGKTTFSLSEDLEITKLGNYTGIYMEDGSDAIVSGIMMIIVENKGEDTLQYGEITLTGKSGNALFKLSTLKPGEKIVVLEANRKQYNAADVYTDAAASNVVYFAEPVSTMEDTFALQPLDGGFNITNISNADIDGVITVYFKNAADGMLYGGITYRGKIEGGMKAGEIRQIMSKNFSASGSVVVFVTVTEN